MAKETLETLPVVTDQPVIEDTKKPEAEQPIPATLTPTEFLSYISYLTNVRKKFEPAWYRAYHAYENNCFVGWSERTQTIVKMPYKKRFFINLPEVKRQCDSFENNLLQFMPLFVVYPDDIANEKSRNDSRFLSKLLKKHYVDWDSKNLVHKYLHNAIKWPISFWEIGVEKRINPLTGNTERVIVPNVSDVFDWFFDPRMPFDENPIIIKKIKRNLKDIKEYQDFKAPTVSGGMPDDMKAVIFNDKYGLDAAEGQLKTQYVFQIFEKLQKGIKETILDTGGSKLREKMYWGTNDYPATGLALFSNDEYSPSFAENLIPINRSINLIANRIEEFIMKFAKGAFLVRDGSDVMFSDENGVIVKYEGEQPTVMDMPQLPQSIILWLNMLFTIAERYGQNQIAMGLTPQGSQNRSAAQGDQAIKGAQVQQKTPLDNMVQAFKRIAEKTVYYLSEFTDEPTSFSFRSAGDNFSETKFIGEKWAKKDPTAVPIPHNIKSMEIEIEDVSASSIYAKRQDLLAIAKEWGAIPPPFQEALLDLYKVGNTADIMAALEKNKTLLDNPEFQAIISQMRAGNVDPATKQAFSVFMDWLSKQSPAPAADQMGVQSNTPAGQPMSPGTEKPPMPPDVRATMKSLITPNKNSAKPATPATPAVPAKQSVSGRSAAASKPVKPSKKVSFKNRK